MQIAYRASRYGQGEEDEGDYINCPFSKEEYYTFVDALLQAERIELRAFEDAIKSGVKAGHFFEGCLPIEIIAERNAATDAGRLERALKDAGLDLAAIALVLPWNLPEESARERAEVRRADDGEAALVGGEGGAHGGIDRG